MIFKDDLKIGLEEAVKLLMSNNDDAKKLVKMLSQRTAWRVVPEKVTQRTYENLKTEKTRVIPSAPAGTHVPMSFMHYTEDGTFMIRYAKTFIPGTATKSPSYEPLYMPIEQKGYLISDDPEVNFILHFNPKNKVDFERYDMSDKTSAALERDKKANILRQRVYDMSEESVKAALRACANSKHVTNVPDPSRSSADTARVALLRIINNPNTDLKMFAEEILDQMANDLITAVQKAIQNKTVVYDITKKTWTWASGKAIVKNNDDDVPEQVLLNHFKKSKNIDLIIDELKSGLVLA